TWEWDGIQWTQRFPAVSPSKILSFGGNELAHDDARARTVLTLGGQPAPLPYNVLETWEWDGTQWTKLASFTGAGVTPLAYDSARMVTVQFGGAAWNSLPLVQYFDTTREWAGAAWVGTNPSFRPPARSSHAMTYDSKRRRVVLFGGVF